MNNIWRKNIYHGVINSYIKTPNSPKIRGTLLEIDENKIKVAIGNKKALDITLDKPMDAEVGEDIIIDRRNIKESKLVKQTDKTADDEQAAQDIQNKYDYILKSFDIPVNAESTEAIKSLENHGMNITKENVLSFMLAKEQLSDISEKLDYDTAVRIAEKNVDFDKESLQKVLQEMQKVQGEKRPFSLLRFLGIKKDMTTEEAEKIAYEIYGNKAGKDITDIIKALDKAGLDTSKKNIEQINNIFSKLHDIKDIENKTIIDSVKNKIDTSIDNLYKLKNAVAKGAIKVEQKLGQLANKVYNAYSSTVGVVTEKELTQIEGDIKNRLQDMGIRITDETVKLSKDVIATGLDLTGENLQKIMSVKGAIVELNSDLDYEKTAFLIASGVNVEKVEVVELKDMINIEHDMQYNTTHDTEHIPAEHSMEDISSEHDAKHIPEDHGTEYISAENDTEHISPEQGTENTPAEHDIEHISIEYDTGNVPAENSTEHIPIEQGIEHISMKYDTEHISAEHDVVHTSMEKMEHIPVEHDTGHVSAGHNIGHILAERGITLGLDRLEILELAENIDIKTLAFHMKLDLLTTLESLNISQQLIDGDITIDEWLNTLNEQLNQNEQLNSDVQSTETEQKGSADIQIEKIELNIPKTDQSTEQSLNTATEEVEQLDTPEMAQTQTSEIPQEPETKPIETPQTEIARELEQRIEISQETETTQEIETTQMPAEETNQVQPGETIDVSNNLQTDEIEQGIKTGDETGFGTEIDTENNLKTDEIKTEEQSGTEEDQQLVVEKEAVERDETIAETQDNEPASMGKLSIDEVELLETLDRLVDTGTIKGLDFIAQGYLKANSDRLGTLMEENYMDEIARAIMQSGISLNDNNIQDIYMLKKALERTIENLTADAFQNAVDEGISLEKTGLKELVDIINILNKEKINQNTEVKNILNNIENIGAGEKGPGVTKNITPDIENDTKNAEIENILQNVKNQNILEDKFDITENKETGNTIKNSENVTKNENIIPEENIKQGGISNNVLESVEGTTDENVSAGTEKLTDEIASANTEQAEEIVDKVKSMVDILKQISPERKNTIISLLMKNAMPLTLKEVQNLSFFLNNQRQIGHQLDEILNLIDKNENPEVIRIAGELKNAVNEINRYIKAGKQIEGRPYEDFSKLLKELESKSPFLTKEDKETLQKVGEKLLDSLELQLQLNREDTVLQLPLMMSEYLKNLQIYVMRDKKGSKKINPKDMSILLNFDTNNMGNVNIYVAVNYKNIVMKMGLANEEDQNLIEKYSDELESHLEELGYDLKDLSFRIS
ncbi:MAG TPA: DUF6240 domain-containing protein, partial [Clostridia bacterium]|nr:DUF6240 domain-containing protein [Clostridia bacterium]